MTTFKPPERSVAQTLIWTALPQGLVNGKPGKVRISAFVSPQLSFSETVGYRSETSTELSTFPDWVNWPATVANPAAPITFEVVFSTLTHSQSVKVTPDLTALQPNYWEAMFGAETTRVDSFGFQDFTKSTPVSFSTLDAHATITDTYNAFTSTSATTIAAAATNPSKFTDPSTFSLHLLGDPATLKTTAGLSSAVSALHATGIPANIAAATVISPPKTLQNALAFHSAPANNTAIPAQTVPILDFHQAISSLGHFPELLRYFGLLFPLEVTLPTDYTSSTVFTIAVIPQWTPLAATVPTTVNVPVATVCTLANRNFLSAPDPAESLYKDGALNLGSPTFLIVDVDVDKAAHSLNGLSQNLSSTLALHASASTIEPGSPTGTATVPAGTTLPYSLPALRGAGLSLIWSGFGAAGQGLNALAQRQATLSQSIASWINSHPYLRSVSPQAVLYTEDLTRGWRIDVSSDNGKDWKSLHWRNATYVFGEEGGNQITVAETTPIEGMVSPAASHAPTAAGAIPSELYIHEMITRWVGWSLSAPRPGGQVNDDGSVSPTAVGNPAVPTHYVDEYGNYNPQISATFAATKGKAVVTDPVDGTALGTTGLPTLRFGTTYRLAARAVDLGGWSLPQGHGVQSAPITHARWEPVKAPLALPVAPLTAGEGVHTVVIRDDDVTPARPNGRWLFPPRVPERLAEEHGALDVDGVPSAARYSYLAQYNDGSLGTIDGAVEESSAGGRNLILPTSLPETVSPNTTLTRPPITWIADPASYGYALSFEPPPGLAAPELTAIISSAFNGAQPFTSFPCNITGLPGISPIFTDKWADSGEAWPKLSGKMLMLVPVDRTSGVKRLSSGVIVPGLSAGTKASASPDLIGLDVTPGSVYQVRLSSLFPPSYVDDVATKNVLGLVPGLLDAIAALPGGVLAKDVQLVGLLEGQVPQLTPYHTVQLVYAVLKPLVAPAFSTGSTGVQFVRQPDGITVAISDAHYVVDIPTTETVTYEATWTDPYDNPADPTNTDPGTATKDVAQGGLVVTVGNIYANAIAADPMVPVSPATDAADSPFGTVTPSGEDGGVFSATHRIGDTKHHLVTYTSKASTRFAAFFTETTTLSLSGTTPGLIDARGVDANTVSVRVVSSGDLVPAGNYSVDAAAGTISLIRAKYTILGRPNPPFQNEPLAVSYTPTDTTVGKTFKVHVPSTTAPPPIKVAKVAPSWSIATTGKAPSSGYKYTRTGNSLRVYMDRPWYVTGANEMVGVLSAYVRSGTGESASVVSSVNVDDVTLMALDPINVGSLSRGYSQTQLSFVTPSVVPSSGGYITDTFALAGGNPVRVPSTLDSSAQDYAIWGYEPQFDTVSGHWYVDIQLAMDSFVDNPPPGYFLRLALARLQPYSLGYAYNPGGPVDSSNNRYLSPTTLVTLAQPVSDRSVTVVSGIGGVLDVTVTGPGYYGFRPAPDGPTEPWVHDSYNEYALHPYSDRAGTKSTSTMIVEVETYDDSAGFSGDFGWSTVADYVFKLEPVFDGTPIVTWKNSSANPVQLPPFSNLANTRLKISELDYYQAAAGASPPKANTEFRRTFIAHIPL